MIENILKLAEIRHELHVQLRKQGLNYISNNWRKTKKDWIELAEKIGVNKKKIGMCFAGLEEDTEWKDIAREEMLECLNTVMKEKLLEFPEVIKFNLEYKKMKEQIGEEKLEEILEE